MSFVDVLKSAITSNKEAKLVNAEGGVVEDIGAAEFVQIGDSEKFKLGEESQFKGSKMYDVKSVYFCWMNRDAAVTEYIELCENNKVDVISFVEKTDLISYLKGETDTSNYVIKPNSDEKDGKKRGTRDDEKVDYKESKRLKIESDPLLKEISKHEIELVDHDKALRGTQKANDFSNLIRECEYKIVRPLKSASKKPSTTSKDARKKEVAGNDSSSLATILKKKDPIIILSPSAISMLTMNNVKLFLQDGKFVDPQDIKEGANLNMVQVIRQSKKFGKKIKFVVVSNVEKFFVKPEYWDRVVAVFTTGQEWQFKNYKINQPNLLFQKVKGFYVNYSGDVIPNNIKNWNVQVISLDRNQRFKDRQVSEFLWESIERFMMSRGYN
ncbi:Cell division control protein 73 [Pichia kudriavzevii]|uniref:Cell division control protein 73 n=1 Tax=Pichia kudriavzevii TaxID=4909 RepID=A0A1V2LL68_PICKU|nr:Cell division control protein 73 [Pichia kudriavzevii]